MTTGGWVGECEYGDNDYRRWRRAPSFCLAFRNGRGGRYGVYLWSGHASGRNRHSCRQRSSFAGQYPENYALSEPLFDCVGHTTRDRHRFFSTAMTRKLGTLIACLSVVLFPWPLTAFLSLSISLFEPLVPLAVGLLADTLYYAPVDGAWPHFAFLRCARKRHCAFRAQSVEDG